MAACYVTARVSFIGGRRVPDADAAARRPRQHGAERGEADLLGRRRGHLLGGRVRRVDGRAQATIGGCLRLLRRLFWHTLFGTQFQRNGIGLYYMVLQNDLTTSHISRCPDEDYISAVKIKTEEWLGWGELHNGRLVPQSEIYGSDPLSNKCRCCCPR